MIIQELYSYYLRKLEEEDSVMPKRYWSREKVAWEFKINTEGDLLAVTPLSQGEGKGARQFRELLVPEHSSRSSGIKPFFLCDKAAYFLGLDEKRGEDSLAASKQLHSEILCDIGDEGSAAVKAFFSKSHNDDPALCEIEEELKKGGFIAFVLEGDSQRVHERPAVIEAWLHHANENSGAHIGQCGITGNRSAMARLFPTVPGVPGAQSSGASLVSFNLDAFESYGKKQAYNASLSEEVSFGAGAALKHLLNDRSHRTRIGETTVIFWADRPAPAESFLLKAMFESDSISQEAEDDTQVLSIKEAFESIKHGREPIGVNSEVKFYMLGMSPNAARLAVRFFEESTFGQIEKNFGSYLRDIEMEGVKSTSLYSYLRQVSPLGKLEEIPSTLISSSFKAMIWGRLFPQSLYMLLLSRMRSDHASRNKWDMGTRAAMMKAYLLRKARSLKNSDLLGERGLTVALNESNTRPGYLLGRLFAVMEKAQQDAIPGINATISDRYIGSASTTPARVFPHLLNSAQDHLGKLRKSKPGAFVNTDKLLRSICEKLSGENPFPKTLDSEEQGLFFIGYYQQKEMLWKKKADEEVSLEEALTE